MHAQNAKEKTKEVTVFVFVFVLFIIIVGGCGAAWFADAVVTEISWSCDMGVPQEGQNFPVDSVPHLGQSIFYSSNQ